MNDLSKDLVRTDKEKESVRLNKYLSDAGFCSRREADRMIQEGRVLVNDVTAVLGQKVRLGQVVKADGKILLPCNKLILIAFHKPAGIECTTDPKNPDNIVRFIGYPERIYPVGRLDKNSTGLILLTNTGEIVNKILKASNYHEKEYMVTVDKKISPAFIEKIRAGVTILLEDGTKKVKTRKCKADMINEHTFSIVLTQGLNRQIRRMCRELGYEVTALKRIRIMNLYPNGLKEGTYRHLTKAETEELVKE